MINRQFKSRTTYWLWARVQTRFLWARVSPLGLLPCYCYSPVPELLTYSAASHHGASLPAPLRRPCCCAARVLPPCSSPQRWPLPAPLDPLPSPPSLRVYTEPSSHRSVPLPASVELKMSQSSSSSAGKYCSSLLLPFSSMLCPSCSVICR
jgi:hypothetical protein